MLSIQEEQLAKNMDRAVNRFAENKRYRQYFDKFESQSLVSKIRTIQPYDLYALGKMFEGWEFYQSICSLYEQI